MDEEHKQHELEHTWDPVSTLPAGTLFIPIHSGLFIQALQLFSNLSNSYFQ